MRNVVGKVKLIRSVKQEGKGRRIEHSLARSECFPHQTLPLTVSLALFVSNNQRGLAVGVDGLKI